MTICAAPNCQNKQHSESMHCRTHAHKFSSMYLKYKKAQVPINKYIDNPKSITRLSNNELLRTVSISNTVAVLRKEYQCIAFKKEFHDEGHTKFIEKLLKLSDVVTSILKERFQSYLNTSSSEESDHSSSSEECIVVNNVIKKIVDDFLITREDLIEELDKIIQYKEYFFDNMRQRISTILDVINNSLTGGDLSLEDRTISLLFSLDWIETAYNEALEGAAQEQEAMNILQETGAKDPRILKLYDLEGTSGHLLSRKDRIFNWDTMLTLDECIELIYQGRVVVPTLIDNYDVYDAAAALIDAARLHPFMFVWHFDVDLLNDNELTVHVTKATGRTINYSAKLVKNRRGRS